MAKGGTTSGVKNINSLKRFGRTTFVSYSGAKLITWPYIILRNLQVNRIQKKGKVSVTSQKAHQAH